MKVFNSSTDMDTQACISFWLALKTEGDVHERRQPEAAVQ